MEPVLKWAGGKRQLLSTLLTYLTPELLNGHRYYEPFIGGGSVAFKLEHPQTTINDLNYELINVYRVVKESPNELIEQLKIHEKNHCKEYYYKIREMDRQEGYSDISHIEKAARTIYMNKACFNGLYRVNRNNYFNVPFGRQTTKSIVQEERIRQLSKYLNQDGVVICEGDYVSCLKNAQQGDVVYFDPPYDYEISGFNSYVTSIFGHDELERLRDVSLSLIEKGCIVILSNNDTTFVRNTFSDDVFHISSIEAKRFINCKGNRRTGVKEVIIYGKK